jgi:hypothetical protein
MAIDRSVIALNSSSAGTSVGGSARMAGEPSAYAAPAPNASPM